MANSSAGSEKSRSTRAYSRKNYVYKFRDFLLKTYPDILQSCSDDNQVHVSSNDNGVLLDVAGGKGTLSWLLNNCDNVNSVVADPRICKFDRLGKSVLYLKQNPDVASDRTREGKPTYQPLATLVVDGFFDHINDDSSNDGCSISSDFKKPQHLRLLVDNQLVHAMQRQGTDKANTKNSTTSPSSWCEYFDDASRRAREAMPLGYRELEDDNQGGALDEAGEVLRTLQSVKLVVGFHPDQATEACIDLAMCLGVPFCIVPCCVFPSEFPNRRVKSNGERVNRYRSLIQYLKEKVPWCMRVAELEFSSDTAKNIVLYSLPEDMMCKEIVDQLP
mmetsp:Transcript_32779/g.47445  ORF Transcript_32779/g.47445 Transcript_32779/m.47445 type:complete len:332 (-) Transcript_32779:165-1160(-)|eukprot:CAMPEP_0116013694 /NCGR_PEP_ID=MMETSP0321-20121206/5868_1 /TAXON_ID=163516 /ORGANISM="Leptocylindrus danicus var. danicus, Strain B650" /LENGTH=331 /DNA_ID=CAMNT_0003483271 /DNA_START=191 /DNA_END=1186 /DNA_ORIENTATION=-